MRQPNIYGQIPGFPADRCETDTLVAVVLYLPAVEFIAKSQLSVVDDSVLSHELLGPYAVSESLLWPDRWMEGGRERVN